MYKHWYVLNAKHEILDIVYAMSARDAIAVCAGTLRMTTEGLWATCEEIGNGG